MKKALSLILVLVMCLSLCACGDESSSQTKPTTTATSDTGNFSEDTTNKLSLGETASTDRAEFTLVKSEFTYYVINSGDEENLLAPKANAGDTYAASIGDCFVALTFTLTNKDRTSISYGGPVPEWEPKWTVSYGGADYPVNGFNVMPGFSYIDLCYSVIVDKNYKATEVNQYSNYTLKAGETVSFRTFGVIDTDPANLTDGFDFTIGIINSAGEYEYFTYCIPAKQ